MIVWQTSRRKSICSPKAGLNRQQHYHRDSVDKFGVSAILVLECNETNSFSYYKGSHESTYNGGIDHLNLSEDNLTTIIQVKKDHIIFFAGNLVHGGGPSQQTVGSECNRTEVERAVKSIGHPKRDIILGKNNTMVATATRRA